MSAERRIALFGHRGARGAWPENTMEGFAAACACGVTGFETDIGLTAEGVAVLHHDITLNSDVARDPSGAYVPPGLALRGLGQAALATYDVGRIRPGSPYAARFPHQAPRDGARIPTLEAALAAFADLFWLIEMKTRPGDAASPEPAALAEATIAAIRRAGAADRCALLAFDWRCLHEARRIAPGIRRVCLSSAATEAEVALWWALPPASGPGAGPIEPYEAAASVGAFAWAAEADTASAARIEAARARGLKVLVWTVNDATRALEVAHHADAIITDYPAEIGAALRDDGFLIRAPGEAW